MKKAIILMLCAMALFVGIRYAISDTIMMPTDDELYAITHELTSVESSASSFAGLSTAQRDRFREAHISSVSGSFLFRCDGVDPTTSVGLRINAASGTSKTADWVVIKDNRSWSKFKMISAAGASPYVIIYGK